MNGFKGIAVRAREFGALRQTVIRWLLSLRSSCKIWFDNGVGDVPIGVWAGLARQPSGSRVSMSILPGIGTAGPNLADNKSVPAGLRRSCRARVS